MCKTVSGMQVVVGLERVPVHMCAVEDGKLLRENIEPADALLVVMAPAKPGSVDETIRLRIEILGGAVEARDGLIEGVVIMKDPDVPWNISTPAVDGSTPPLKYHTPDEKRLSDEEWQEGADKGYEVARKLGVGATIACPRTGEGVKEAVEDLVVRVMHRRKAEAKAAKLFEERMRLEEKRRRMPGWKRLFSKARIEE